MVFIQEHLFEIMKQIFGLQLRFCGYKGVERSHDWNRNGQGLIAFKDH